MVKTANEIFRDFVTDGVPSSGANKPSKVDIREWGTSIEAFTNASGSALVYQTRAALFADLLHDANTMAWVVADSTTAYNGIYQKSGSSGAGSWTRVADLPYSFIIATDAGAGTANTIQATTALPVSSKALVLLNIFETNTSSPVTVSFNGETALTVKSNSGNDIVAGGLQTGMEVLGIVSGSTFRLVSDQVSAAIIAAAEDAADTAVAAALETQEDVDYINGILGYGDIRRSPAFHKFGGQLQEFHSALADPLNQYVSAVFVGDSITWGTGSTGTATDTPRNRTLDDPRNNSTSACYVNNFKNYIGKQYFNNASPTLSNPSGSASGEAISTYKKSNFIYPKGTKQGFTEFQSGGSTSFTETATAGAKLGYRYILADGNAAGTSVIQFSFRFTGSSFKLWYTSIASSSSDYDVTVEGIGSLGTFSSNSGGTANGLTRTHTFAYVKNKLVTIKLVRTGAVPANQNLHIEAIEVEKTCQIINQGIIGSDTRSYLEFCLTGNYPTLSPLPPATTTSDQFVFLMLGTNDRSKFTIGAAPNNVAHGVLTLKNGLENIIARLFAINRSVRPILMIANKTNDESPVTYDFTMAEVRDIVTRVGLRKNIDVIDNYAPFIDLDATDYLSDTLHPNDNGHRVISENIIGSIEACASDGRFTSVFYPEQYGATFDGSNDADAIELACNEAVIAGGVMVLTAGRTYTFSKVAIPANTNFQTRGSTLRSDGTLTTAGDITLAIGDNCVGDEILLTTPGTETNTDIVSLGLNVYLNRLEVLADVQRAGGGITSAGDRIRIGTLKTKNIDRPIIFFNQSLTTRNNGSRIDFLDVENYVRAFRADFCSFEIGEIKAIGRSANASKTAGHNGVLVQGCSDWAIGNCFIQGAGEHAFRIGGSPHTTAITKNFAIGVITAVDSGGCAFKCNTTLLVSPGVTEKAYNGNIQGVIGIDTGEASVVGNEELLRLTHVRQMNVGYALAYTDNETQGSQYLAQVNDIDDVTIGTLGGENIAAGFVSIDGTSDTDGVSFFGGDVTDFRVLRMTGVCAGNNAIGVNTTFNVGRVHLKLDGISGFATNVLLWSAGTLTNVFELSGRIGGAVAPVLSGAPNSDNFIVDIQYNNTRSMGRGAAFRGGTSSVLQVMTAAFSASNVVPSSLFINATQATSGIDTYGGAVEFSRPASGRRGGAVACRQYTANAYDTGLELLVGNAVTVADDSLLAALRLYQDRSLAIPDGITAPATASGWAKIYVDTADGDLKVKFGDGTVKTIVVDT